MSKMTRCNVCGESEVDAYTELYGQGWTRCLRCAEGFSPAVTLHPRLSGEGMPGPQPDYETLARQWMQRAEAAEAVGSPAEPEVAKLPSVPGDLREQLARVIVGQEYPGEPRKWEMLAGSPQLAHYLRMADALMAGPLAPLLAAESDLSDALAELATAQNDGLFWQDANQQFVAENNKLLAQVARYEAALADTPENIEVAKKVFWRHNGSGSCVAAVLAHIRRQAEMPAAQPEQAVIPDIGDSYEAALRVWAASNS